MKITEVNSSFLCEGINHLAYIAYDSEIEEKRPIIFVIPEWWGLNDYSKSRARQLAELGYFAVALDVFGEGRQGNNPEEANQLASTFYKDPSLCKTILESSFEMIEKFPQADLTKKAAIGYCMGGFFALNAAKEGVDLNGVVSFHGGLGGIKAEKGKIKAHLLICHGAADDFVNSEVPAFKEEMAVAGAHYEFKEYAGATHAFTNPNATENGKKFNMPIEYNAAADRDSWNDMKAFFKTIFN